jgi:hypothetical protein
VCTAKKGQRSGCGAYSSAVEVRSVPKLMLELGGKSVALQPAHVLETQQRPETKWFYGNLGIDLLRQAQRVTTNFKMRTLHLDNAEAANAWRVISSRPHVC